MKLVSDQAQKISHNLNTKKVQVIATDVDGKVVRGRINIIDVNNIEFTPLADASQAMISVTGKPGDQTFIKDMLDLTMRMLIGVQNIQFTYAKGGGTVLPGYLPEPRLFGAGKYTPEQEMFDRSMPTNFAPGMPFLLGWQDRNFGQTAAENGWITTDSTLNTPYSFTQSERLTLRSIIEPLPDLRITVSANRSMNKKITEFYNYDPLSNRFRANSFTESGSFSMSTLTWVQHFLQ